MDQGGVVGVVVGIVVAAVDLVDAEIVVVGIVVVGIVVVVVGIVVVVVVCFVDVEIAVVVHGLGAFSLLYLGFFPAMFCTYLGGVGWVYLPLALPASLSFYECQLPDVHSLPRSLLLSLLTT